MPSILMHSANSLHNRSTAYYTGQGKAHILFSVITSTSLEESNRINGEKAGGRGHPRRTSRH